MATSQVASTSLIAALTPNAVRGRVMSLLMLNMGVAQALTLPVAVVGQAVSLETLFPILAFTCLGLVTLVLLTHPAIWRARMSAAFTQPGSDDESLGKAAANSASGRAAPIPPIILAIAQNAPNKGAGPGRSAT